MEIYNEHIYDLLTYWPDGKAEVLQVVEDPHKGFLVKNLSEHYASCMEEVMELIEKGESNRRYATTAMNHNSSRSHTIFRVNLISVLQVN